MTQYRKRAEEILNTCLQTRTTQEIQRLRKVGKAKRWLALFPHLSQEEQFEVLVCEIKDSIENHKNRLTNHGNTVFEVYEVHQLYQRYYEGLYHFDKLPSVWFAQCLNEKDRTEIAQIICYVEIQKMKNSLAYLRHDLTAIGKEKSVHHKNMRYTIDFLCATIRFKNFDKNGIESVTKNDFINIMLVPFEGFYKKNLANYLLENQIVTHQNTKNQETNISVFSHNLEVSLAHYNANKGITKSIEFEAELQGGAGILKIGIYPWKFKFVRFDEFSPVFGMFVGLLNMFNVFRSVSLIFNVVLAFILTGILGIFMFISWKRREKQKEFEKKTYFEVQYLDKNNENNAQIVLLNTSIYEDILRKLHKDISVDIILKDTFNNIKKYANPIDILNLYKRKIDEINQMGLVYLREFKISSSKHVSLSVMQYILKIRLRKSLQHFMKVANLLVENSIEATIHIKFFDINATTNGFYGHFWAWSKAGKYRGTAKTMASICSRQYIRPEIEGENMEDFNAWIEEKEQQVIDTTFENDLYQLKLNIDLYLATKNEKVPFILDLEEVIVYF
ncbi:MAG: hypothetical protein EAZ95_05260 [Bacteroidetes bacterium]|nr:MAG: hypothetical protein EAZ95_05260 [Bacteroidota bacterium]